MSLTVANCTDARLRKELTFVAGKAPKGRVIQELLTLAGHGVAIDGDVGPATNAAIAAFRAKAKLKAGSAVDQELVDALAQPLLRAVEPVKPAATLSQTVIRVAERHLAEHPVEVGGANRGPWVRLYMKGQDGPGMLWCAGFVTYLLKAAADLHGQKIPVPETFSCDTIGTFAHNAGTLIREASVDKVKPGDLFLVPQDKFDWVHVGLVVGTANGVFTTIEGNTNDDGSREGFEVCKRTRAPSKVDLVRI